MCGIAGFTQFLDPNQGRIRLEHMRRELGHRGPDGSGVFQDTAAGTGLCHTRLSILDPGPRANQPMHLEKRWTLVFNGEIYNFRELRETCTERGEVFLTTSDTEVVLRVLAREGVTALERLRGMFALALWDGKERSLLLARDAFGIKPLYHTTGEPRAFASEIRPLLAAGWVPPELCPRGTSLFFQRGSCHPAQLPIAGLRALPPGSWLRWTEDKTEHGSFAGVRFEDPPFTGTVESIGQAWRDSVRAHMVSDVPVGVFLSGGIDSAAILAGLSGGPAPMPESLTLSFPGFAGDETQQAAATARHFGSRHHVRTVDPVRELPGWFEEHLRGQDLPSIDGFNVACIARAAREHGFKVVLSGLGGDEWIGGYPSFRNIPRMVATGAVLARIPGASGLAARTLRMWGGRWGRMADFLDGEPTALHAGRLYRQLFDDASLQAMGMHPSVDSAVDVPHDQGRDIRNVIASIEVEGYLRPQLLRDADACSMAHGVELRVPFLDLPLWRQSATLDPSLRYEPGKRLLARVLPNLPSALFRRPKKGFSLPWEDWLSGPLGAAWHDVPVSVRPHCRTWYQRMAWIAFTSWKRNTLRLP